jgi:hypothetical protein
MPEAEHCAVRVWREAENAAEREEVYSFRYAHYFKYLPDAPGVDPARRRVYSPHDDRSVHLTGRDAKGKPVIVGTGTRASTPGLPEIWHKILRLERLAPLGSDKILIYSKLVELEGCRGSPVFPDFFKYASRYFTSRGFTYTVHYCAPPLVPLYERLGYRLYGNGVSMPGGLYRLPLLLAGFDDAHLGRVSPAFRQATADLSLTGDLEQTFRLLPELARTPLCVLASDERLAFARELSNRFAPAKSGGPDLPRGMEKILRRSSILRLGEGDSPIHPADAPSLWFVLDGLCLVRLHDGSEVRTGSGTFINGSACSTFTALEPSGLVLCAPGRFGLAGRPAVLPFAFWEEFSSAGGGTVSEYPAALRRNAP